MHSSRVLQECIDLLLSLSQVQCTGRDGCSCAEDQHMPILCKEDHSWAHFTSVGSKVF